MYPIFMEIDSNQNEGCSICQQGSLHSYLQDNRDRWMDLPIQVSVKICSICESGTTYPLLKNQDLGSLYPEEYSSYIGERKNFLVKTIDKYWLKRRYTRLLEQVPFESIRANESVLDIGCGSGNLIESLKIRGCRTFGVDPSEDAIRSLKNRGIESFRGYSDEFLEYARANKLKYDTIIFHHSLEHFADLDAFREILKELVLTEGKVVIAVPLFSSIQRRWFKKFWLPLDLPRHRFHFSEKGLIKLFEQEGYKIDYIKTSTSNLGFFGSLQYRIFGKCLTPSGSKLYLAHAILLLLTPLRILLSKIKNSEDTIILSAKKTT